MGRCDYRELMGHLECDGYVLFDGFDEGMLELLILWFALVAMTSARLSIQNRTSRAETVARCNPGRHPYARIQASWHHPSPVRSCLTRPRPRRPRLPTPNLFSMLPWRYTRRRRITNFSHIPSPPNYSLATP